MSEKKKPIKQSSKEKLIAENTKAYQSLQDNDVNLTREDDDAEEHKVAGKDELKGETNKENKIKEIKSKCKFKQEYVDNNIILSVNHLKQYFFFGSGAKRFKLKAVHDVSFQVKEGECFGIVGESGCGKTTTGRSIIRLYNITSGSIYYKGHRIGAGSRWNEKEIKFTKIRLRNELKELNEKLKNKEIDQETYTNKVNEAKIKAENIIKVQQAKIKQIHYDDNHYDRKLMREIQMIFQDPIDSLDSRMTVESIISEGLKIQGSYNHKENHKKVVEALERVVKQA